MKRQQRYVFSSYGTLTRFPFRAILVCNFVFLFYIYCKDNKLTIYLSSIHLFNEIKGL